MPASPTKGRDACPLEEIQITGNNRGWLAETGSYLTAHGSEEPEFNDQVEDPLDRFTLAQIQVDQFP